MKIAYGVHYRFKGEAIVFGNKKYAWTVPTRFEARLAVQSPAWVSTQHGVCKAFITKIVEVDEDLVKQLPTGRIVNISNKL